MLKPSICAALAAALVCLALPLQAQVDEIAEVSPQGIPEARFTDINLPNESVSEVYKSVTTASGEGVAFSPDGRFVYVTSYRLRKPETKKLGWGQHIQKIDTVSGKPVQDILIDIDENPQNPLKPLLAPISGVSFYDVNAVGVTVSQKYVAVLLEVSEYRAGSETKYVPVLFDAATGKPVKALGGNKPLSVVMLDTPVFSQDGRYLMAMGDRGREVIFVWDTQSGNLVAKIQRERQDFVLRPNFAGLANGQILYAARESNEDYDNSLQVYDLASRSSREVFGPGWDFALFKYFSIGNTGKVLMEACREGGEDETDEYCGNSHASPRWFNLPGFGVAGRLPLFNSQNIDLSEFVDDSPKFQWTHDDSHLLMVGEGSSGDTVDRYFALVFDTEANRIVSLTQLPIRKEHTFYVTGVTPEKEFLVLGMQPRSPSLRIVRIPAEGN